MLEVFAFFSQVSELFEKLKDSGLGPHYEVPFSLDHVGRLRSRIRHLEDSALSP
jgi:hypothetical protein